MCCVPSPSGDSPEGVDPRDQRRGLKLAQKDDQQV